MTGDPYGFTRFHRLEDAEASPARKPAPPPRESRPPEPPRESRPPEPPPQPAEPEAVEPEAVEHEDEREPVGDDDDSETTAIARDEPTDEPAEELDEDLDQPAAVDRELPPSVQPRLLDDPRLKMARQRGTQHLGLMVLRVGVGVVLVIHGMQKMFGWWDGPGIDGFKNSLTELGFQHADILSYLAAGAQIVAGALLVLGLFTPVVAAGALAYLVNSLLADIATQRQHGHLNFFLPGGNEYHIVLIIALVAIILAGPGLYGFDAGRGWARRPFIGSSAALLIGVGGGIGFWALFNGVNPLA